jgi:hypothetical protein
MASVIRKSLAAAFTAVAMGGALPQSASADGPTGVEQEAAEGRVQGIAIAPKAATETLRGDEGYDTLKVRLSQDKTEEFEVQDGLIFNAVRFGDTVEVTVEKDGEKRTIVSLRRNRYGRSAGSCCCVDEPALMAVEFATNWEPSDREEWIWHQYADSRSCSSRCFGRPPPRAME